jgi:malonyl-CoA O-methyltransferase
MKLMVAASFSRAARTYRAHAGVQDAMAGWLATWLPLARSGRVLEVGAGPGVFTRLLLPWRGEIVATDAVPAMCAAGRAELPGVEWQVMRAEAPLPGSWDWIVSSSALQWVDSPAKMFAAWRESLSPGGRVLAGFFVAESLPELRALAGGVSPVAWRTPAIWREEIARSGLKLLRDEAVRHVRYYSSAKEFLRALHCVGAAPERRLTAGAMRKLLRDYDARYGGARGVSATWTFYRFEAERA